MPTLSNSEGIFVIRIPTGLVLKSCGRGIAIHDRIGCKTLSLHSADARVRLLDTRSYPEVE